MARCGHGARCAEPHEALERPLELRPRLGAQKRSQHVHRQLVASLASRPLVGQRLVETSAIGDAGEAVGTREKAKLVRQLLHAQLCLHPGEEEGFPHRGTIDFSENRVDASTGTLRARARIAEAWIA